MLAICPVVIFIIWSGDIDSKAAESNFENATGVNAAIVAGWSARISADSKLAICVDVMTLACTAVNAPACSSMSDLICVGVKPSIFFAVKPTIASEGMDCNVSVLIAATCTALNAPIVAGVSKVAPSASSALIWAVLK